MIRLNKLLIIALLAYSLVSCRATRTTTDVSRSDSIRYVERVVVKDSLIRVPVRSDSSLLRAVVECDSMNQAHIAYIMNLESGSRSSASFTLTDNILTLDCKCDSFSIYSIYSERSKQTAESAISTQSESKTIEYSLTFLQKIQVYGFWLLLSLVIIYSFFQYLMNYVRKIEKGI